MASRLQAIPAGFSTSTWYIPIGAVTVMPLMKLTIDFMLSRATGRSVLTLTNGCVPPVTSMLVHTILFGCSNSCTAQARPLAQRAPIGAPA